MSLIFCRDTTRLCGIPAGYQTCGIKCILFHGHRFLLSYHTCCSKNAFDQTNPPLTAIDGRGSHDLITLDQNTERGSIPQQRNRKHCISDYSLFTLRKARSPAFLRVNRLYRGIQCGTSSGLSNLPWSSGIYNETHRI